MSMLVKIQDCKMAETTRQIRKRFKYLKIKVKVKNKRLKIIDHKAGMNKTITKIKTKNKTQELNVEAISKNPRPSYDCEHGSSKSIRNQASREIVSHKISSQTRKLISRFKTLLRENANPPSILASHVLLTALCVKVFQELDELQAISAYIDSRLENIEHFLNGFVNPPNEINMDDLEPDDKSVDTPRVSPFLDSNDDYDDGEVLNELEEYGNARKLCRKKIINNIDGNDLAFPCMISFRKFVAHFDPFLPMKIITCKAYNTKMVEGHESTRRNLVAIVKDVYMFVESFTYVTDFVVLDDIGEFIVGNMVEVVMGKPFINVTQIEYDCVKRIPPIHVLRKTDLMNEFKNFHEKNKLMYKNCLNLGPEYQVDENMKE
uniref:MAK10-like protein n=1 Tax=Tanacetum cinerariifolium TaxID=118510 RepID=A0A699I5Q0_TANCI|nr:hypothetical protein [Tanacetum cinerariifolium]